MHVLADKPMAIDGPGFDALVRAFADARERGVLLYDIMTERFEITTMLQKAFSRIPEVFGELLHGSAAEPAVVKESVPLLLEARVRLAGQAARRGSSTSSSRARAWSTSRRISSISSNGSAFPAETLDFSRDVAVLAARRWPTGITPAQFERLTQLRAFPEFLRKYVEPEGNLRVYANGEIDYRIKGVHAKVRVLWNYEAPPGAGDTHYSVMRGSKATLVIRQGAAEGWQPTLYIEPATSKVAAEMPALLAAAMPDVQAAFNGVDVERAGSEWRVLVPQEYHVGHEAHFGQVASAFLRYCRRGRAALVGSAEHDRQSTTRRRARSPWRTALEACLVNEPDAGLLSLNTATVRKQWTLPQIVGRLRSARHSRHLSLARPGRLRLDSRNLRSGSATAVSRSPGYCRGGMFPRSTARAGARRTTTTVAPSTRRSRSAPPCLVLVVGGLPQDRDGVIRSKDLAGAREMVRDGIGDLLEYARGAGMPLAIEPLHPMYAADRACVNTMAHANDLCDELGAGLGIAVDVYHVGGIRIEARDRARGRRRARRAFSRITSATGSCRPPTSDRPRHDGRRRDRPAADPLVDGGMRLSRLPRGGDLFRQQLVEARRRRGACDVPRAPSGAQLTEARAPVHSIVGRGHSPIVRPRASSSATTPAAITSSEMCTDFLLAA
jgi:hypothetical protein